MSIGIPLFFHAYKWGQRLIVDGGILSNFPIGLFNESVARTIGFRLVSSAEQNYVPVSPNSVWSYLVALASTMMEAHDKEDEKNASGANTIRISTGTVSTTNFNLTNTEKDFLFYPVITRLLSFGRISPGECQ